MKKYINCIICPLSCEIKTSIKNNKKILSITGYKCKKGMEYAKKEITDPKRTLTTTILVKHGNSVLVSVKTDRPVPKKFLLKIMKILNKTKLKAPVKTGQIIIKNILNTGSNIVATKYISAV